MITNRFRVDYLGSSGWTEHSFWEYLDLAKHYANKCSETQQVIARVYNIEKHEIVYTIEPRTLMPTPFQTFYIIWSPTGPTPPKAQHYSRAEADKVCQSMAGRHPRQEFYVMEAKARAKVNNVEFVEASGE